MKSFNYICTSLQIDNNMVTGKRIEILRRVEGTLEELKEDSFEHKVVEGKTDVKNAHMVLHYRNL